MTKVVNGMSVPQLSENTNYDNWSLQMKVLLGSQDVWDIMEDGYNEPADDEHQIVNQIAALKKTQVKDRSNLYFLYNAMDESGFEKIANAKLAKEAWEILKVAYKGDTRVKQVRVKALRREFEHMEIDENEGVVEFITRVQKMSNQLEINGEEVPPNRVAEKILRNLTDDFESIVVTIEHTKDLSTLTVEELAGAEVLAVDGEENGDEVDVAEVIFGMIMKSKPVNRIGVTEDKEKAEEIYKNREEEDEEEMKADEISTNSVWYLDTWASNHMCGNKNFFYKLTKVEAKFMSFGDDSKVAVKGRGTIRHMQKNGRVGEIRDVYYVPELKSNILSMSQIIEKGNSIFMKNQAGAVLCVVTAVCGYFCVPAVDHCRCCGKFQWKGKTEV
ncbi:uncharacterized protein LOC128195311 [Vigna angularis]|uniref:uncharacterized protein LOC128195311 n=1 Tax=Phaseolus angularis TaxID=3914 RepID=UPI0022B50212|nr:uncharacterized protein LOC128195311 [Vigna angularis]